jgi:STE24 endopeptidase
MAEAMLTIETKAKRYTRTKRILSITGSLVSTGIIIAILLSRYSVKLEEYSRNIIPGDYGALLIFVLLISLLTGIVSFPLSFYSSYVVEHKYGLSNQTLTGYFRESLKSTLVGAVIGIPVILTFFYILKTFSANWWLIFGTFIFLLSFVLGRLAPVLILPLFHKLIPITDPLLVQSIGEISSKAGVNVNGVYTFDMSKNTNKINAAFTGIGKSKRILLGDTLISKFTNEEIRIVFAHEAGHYFHKHILKLTLISAVLTFAGLYLTSIAYEHLVRYFTFESITTIAALPLLGLLIGAYGFITTPIGNIISRKFEWEADTFALSTTGDSKSFISAMEKLADSNLSEKSPNKLIEFLFHSHPSIDKRIQFAKDFVI